MTPYTASIGSTDQNQSAPIGISRSLLTLFDILAVTSRDDYNESKFYTNKNGYDYKLEE